MMLSLIALVLAAPDLNANATYRGTDGGWRVRTEQPAAGSAGITNTELRASPLYVIVDGGSITLTNPAPAYVNALVDGGTLVAVQGVGIDGGRVWAVEGQVAITNFPATQAVTGPLTDTQMRATPVPVTLASTTITGTVTTSGPLTDTQLRATPVPISGSVTATVASTTITGTAAVTQSGTWTVQPGNTANTTPWLATARVVGNTGAVVDAVNNATAPANVLMAGAQLQSGASATAGTAGQVGSLVAGLDHVLYVRPNGPVIWSCLIQAATVTTQCQAAAAAGLKNYVSSVSCSNQAATVQGVDIVYGTGAACVTGLTAITHKYQMGTNATTTSPFESDMAWSSPLVPAAASAICVRPTAATAFGCTLTGFTAP